MFGCVFFLCEFGCFWFCGVCSCVCFFVVFRMWFFVYYCVFLGFVFVFFVVLEVYVSEYEGFFLWVLRFFYCVEFWGLGIFFCSDVYVWLLYLRYLFWLLLLV